jgi:hypothetical protein
MGEYIVRSHQLSLVDDAQDGQKPHRSYERGDLVELDDGAEHTANLVRTGAVQSRKAAEQQERAQASAHQLESEVQDEDEESTEKGDEPKTTTTTTTTTESKPTNGGNTGRATKG